MDALRTSNDHDLARRLYHIASLRTAQQRPAEALDWLRAAVLIDPRLAVTAVDDGDFATLRGPDLVRVLDPTRDLDEPR